MSEPQFEDIVTEYLHRMKVEGRIPPTDKIHEDVARALARIIR